MLRDITAVDGGTDLAKYSIIPCFFLWPAARLFNTYNSTLYRLNYLLQAETDWWLDYLNELPSPFSGHLSILHSCALLWQGIGKAASLWRKAQLDTISSSVTWNWLSDLGRVIFTPKTHRPSHITLQGLLFSSWLTQLFFFIFYSQPWVVKRKKNRFCLTWIRPFPIFFSVQKRGMLFSGWLILHF